MLASTEIGLQNIMDGLNEAAKKYDMKINIKKTKVMKISKSGGGVVKLLIDGQQVEQVDKFKYLGAWITDDGRCEVEIKTRIRTAKYTFVERKELLTKNIRKRTKKRIVKALVWSLCTDQIPGQYGLRKSGGCKLLKCGYGEGWKEFLGWTKCQMKTY